MPFALAGERERIDQIVQTSIVEVPIIVISKYPLADDPTSGYIVIGVPQSPRAPHQVIVGGDMRYYGRGATGNRILGEREVGELYARRQRWEVDRDAQLTAVVAAAPLEPAGDGAYMHAFTRPVAFDGGYLRAQLERDEMELRNACRSDERGRRVRELHPLIFARFACGTSTGRTASRSTTRSATAAGRSG